MERVRRWGDGTSLYSPIIVLSGLSLWSLRLSEDGVDVCDYQHTMISRHKRFTSLSIL